MTDPHGDRMDAITKIPYLSTLPLPERRHLAHVCRVRDLSEGARLFAEGDDLERLRELTGARL